MPDYSAKQNAHVTRHPREVWRDLREHMMARLTRQSERDGLSECFDRQLLFAQFAWSGSSGNRSAAMSTITEIIEKLALDLNPLCESRGIQLSFDPFGTQQSCVAGPQVFLAAWCLLVDKATKQKSFSTIEVSLGSCSGGFEVEIGDNRRVGMNQEQDRERMQTLDSPVQEMLDHLLRSAALNWLKCPQGGQVTHLRIPLSAARMAA